MVTPAQDNGNADTVMGRMGLARRSVGNTFGAWLSPLASGLGWWAMRGAVGLGRVADKWRFPDLDQTPIERPVILVGLPRSGTTFLHRFLVGNGVGVGQELWRMLAPSPTLQSLATPILPLMERLSPARFHDPAIHETSLTHVETDDATLLFRHFDGFFLYAFALSHAEDDLRHFVDPAHRDTTDRDFDVYADQWRRSLVATGQTRVVAKLFSAMGRLPALLKRFPDARVVLMIRDPAECIPSAISLVTTTLDARFGFWDLPEATRQRTIERLYSALVALQGRFLSDWDGGLVPRDRVHVVTYPSLIRDFGETVTGLLDFLGHAIDAPLAEMIATIDASQRGRHSAHRYDLARFGLDPDRVAQDSAATRARFLSPGDET